MIRLFFAFQHSAIEIDKECTATIVDNVPLVSLEHAPPVPSHTNRTHVEETKKHQKHKSASRDRKVHANASVPAKRGNAIYIFLMPQLRNVFRFEFASQILLLKLIYHFYKRTESFKESNNSSFIFLFLILK